MAPPSSASCSTVAVALPPRPQPPTSWSSTPAPSRPPPMPRPAMPSKSFTPPTLPCASSSPVATPSARPTSWPHSPEWLGSLAIPTSHKSPSSSIHSRPRPLVNLRTTFSPPPHCMVTRPFRFIRSQGSSFIPSVEGMLRPGSARSSSATSSTAPNFSPPPFSVGKEITPAPPSRSRTAATPAAPTA